MKGSPGRKQIIEEEVTKLLQVGVICPSDSPWSSPIVLVKKKRWDNKIL